MILSLSYATGKRIWIHEGMRRQDFTSGIEWDRDGFDPMFAFPDFYKALPDNERRQLFVDGVYSDATKTLREVEKRLDLGEVDISNDSNNYGSLFLTELYALG